MAGIDIFEHFHTTLFTSFGTGKGIYVTGERMFTRLHSFYVHRVEALDHVISVTAGRCMDELLIWNGEGKEDK